jgi:hypothetical protein
VHLQGLRARAAEFGRFLPHVWFLPFAAITLPFLLLFRLTCYYYRKAYYRSFWLSPPACAVPDRTRSTPARPLPAARAERCTGTSSTPP